MEPARYAKYLNRSLVWAAGARRIGVSGAGTITGSSNQPNDFLSPERAGAHRPTLVWFDGCQEVRVTGVTFTASGFWTQVYTRCRNVQVDGVRVRESVFPNNDGCDFVDCHNAVVENCDFDALDDAVCLKGYTRQGCTNIIVRNNRLRSLCNGIKAGTDSSGGFRNILIEDNVVWQTGISGLALELVDGGVMENVVVRNLKMDVVGTPVFLRLGDRHRALWERDGQHVPGVGALRDISIEGVHATVDKMKKFTDGERAMHNYCPYASSINGIPGHPVEHVRMRDVEIEILGGFAPGTEADAARVVPEVPAAYPENRMFGTLPASAFYIRHARDLRMENIRVAVRQADARPLFVLDDVERARFTGVRTEDISGVKAIRTLDNCRGVEI
jgi:polygalacturonase